MNRIFADFSALEGTNCYCSEDSARAIRERIAGLPLHAVHAIGTGDYHYISLFWLERIGEPFQLVLFDHHPDDQPGAFDGGLLSCGSWVREARRLPMLRADRWIRDAEDFPALAELPDLPVYLSIDLDVLSEEYARTDWDQGRMTLEELKRALRAVIGARRIIGVDLCGGNTPEKGASPDDLALNAVTGEALSDLFRDLS
ncbi:MAG: arginase family protein [Bacteroidales bacterium]|nr:arginase family protein [Bacteroidales bacterium]